MLNIWSLTLTDLPFLLVVRGMRYSSSTRQECLGNSVFVFTSSSKFVFALTVDASVTIAQTSCCQRSRFAHISWRPISLLQWILAEGRVVFHSSSSGVIMVLRLAKSWRTCNTIMRLPYVLVHCKKVISPSLSVSFLSQSLTGRWG